MSEINPKKRSREKKSETPQEFKLRKSKNPDLLQVCTKCNTAKPLKECADSRRCHECERKRNTDRHKQFKIRKLENPDITHICTHCRVEKKLIDCFNSFICNECKKKLRLAYDETLNAKLRSLLHHMKLTSALRKEQGRDEAGICTVTIEDLHEIYEQQNGYCYYFKSQKMNIRGSWMMSVGRINPKKGHTKDNIVLCCLEFNTGAPWSIDKINTILELKKTQVNILEITNDYNYKAPVKARLAFKENLIEGTRFCNYCSNWKLVETFGKKKKKHSKCKECENKQRLENRSHIRSYISSLAKAANRRSKRRSDKSPNKSECTITAEKILNQILLQKGKCYYSGIPLVFKPNSHWRASIERLDTRKDYVDGNWVVICLEFNSICHVTDEDTISTQWTCEKMTSFLSYLENNRA